MAGADSHPQLVEPASLKWLEENFLTVLGATASYKVARQMLDPKTLAADGHLAEKCSEAAAAGLLGWIQNPESHDLKKMVGEQMCFSTC